MLQNLQYFFDVLDNCSALKCLVKFPVSILTGHAVAHKLHVAQVSIPSYWYKSLYSFASL